MAKLNDVISLLRNDIRQGKYPAGKKFPSEYELAESCAVNRITVNKAVNMLIKEGYLERAGSTRAGTIVKSRRPFPEGIIGFVTSMRDYFSTSIASGAIKTASMHNYLLSIVNPETEEINDTLHRMETAGFKGILSAHYGRLKTSLPAVYIDEDSLQDCPECFQVRSDSYGGGCLIAEKVLERGHRDIVYFTKSHSNLRVDLRRLGVTDTLKKHGISDPDSHCFAYNDISIHHCTLALKKILSHYPDLSAIICNTDYIAFNIISAGKNLGLDIPGKISVTGYGNVREIHQIYNLTTTNQHPFELGARACKKLIEIAEGNAAMSAKTEILEVELINGNSIRKVTPAT